MFFNLKWYQQDVSACYHDNLCRLLGANSLRQFGDCCLDTGLSKQTIINRLHSSLEILDIFPLDIMHLINLNDFNLLLGLWCGTIKVYPSDKIELWDWCILVSNIWQAHGKTVALATLFISFSFGYAPWNSAEKINSSYKAWEFQIYLIGLGLALFQHILAKEYWVNYSKYVFRVCILQKWVISSYNLSIHPQNLILISSSIQVSIAAIAAIAAIGP